MPAEPAYIAGPGGGGPGVLVLHAWWGLSDGIRRYCDRLAEAGFVAMAPDLCDGLVRLRAHPAVRGQVGVVGFSMGVWFALDLAVKHPDVAAVILYYGTAGEIDERDEWESPAEVASLEDELRHASRPVRFEVYPGVGHWFAEVDRAEAYDEERPER